MFGPVFTAGVGGKTSRRIAVVLKRLGVRRAKLLDFLLEWQSDLM